MDQKIIAFNKSLQNKNIPEIKVGDIVRVHKRIKEGSKERVQVFKGLVIAIKGKQSSSPMITVRRESQKIGVEATFPIFLPTIEKIEVLRHSKVRRSKLYYMRERSGKSAKMKAVDLTEKEKAQDNEVKKAEDKKVKEDEKKAADKNKKAKKEEKAKENKDYNKKESEEKQEEKK